jgi:hypothetical protein
MIFRPTVAEMPKVHLVQLTSQPDMGGKLEGLAWTVSALVLIKRVGNGRSV